MRSSERRQVVVTGMGCVTPLGRNAMSTWESATRGVSGVGPITRFDSAEFAVHFVGGVSGELDSCGLMPKEVRRLDRNVALALMAAGEAVADAGLVVNKDNRERIGVSIGTGIGGLETLQKAHDALVKGGPRRVSRGPRLWRRAGSGGMGPAGQRGSGWHRLRSNQGSAAGLGRRRDGDRSYERGSAGARRQ